MTNSTLLHALIAAGLTLSGTSNIPKAKLYHKPEQTESDKAMALEKAEAKRKMKREKALRGSH